MKGLTDIPGVLVGHFSDYDALTGCTAVLCPGGAVAGVDVRGSATGTEEFGVLDALHVAPAIHGVCFAGGSAFGLEAVSGVRRWLETKGAGFPTGYAKVPIVPGAILYDLGIGKSTVRPTRESGFAAAERAHGGPVEEGCVGAGTGATVGKVGGMKTATKSGVGSFTVQVGEGAARVSALAVVNAYGDVVSPSDRTILAGTRKSADSMEFADSCKLIRAGARGGFRGGNTTLAVVATNVALSRTQAAKLAQLAQHGLVRAIAPVHTMSDGDLVIALSIGGEKADFTALGIAAAEAVAEAIVRSVRMSWSLGGVPGVGPAPKR